MRLLRVPLVVKIIGANAAVVAVVLGASALWGDPLGTAHEALWWGIAILLGLTVTVGLVLVALRPLRALESTARRIWAGNLEARVPESPLADRDMARIGEALNMVLDGLISDRARMRELASTVISAGDEERARIELTLHDSTAQSLAAISWELSVLAREANDRVLESRVMHLKQVTDDALTDVQRLANSVYPRVLDDLGLAAALTQLSRQAGQLGGLDVSCMVDPDAATPLSPSQVTALYRVAKEGVANALRHATSKRVGVILRTADGTTTLEVRDDGKGFDVPAVEHQRHCAGLFTMRERISLVGGRMEIESTPGVGTRVLAHVPHSLNERGGHT
ncbi:MAG: ATP-binding protein [Gemmatimonadaceae bacterium]